MVKYGKLILFAYFCIQIQPTQMNKSYGILFLFFCLIVQAVQAQQKITAEEYIEIYKDLAISEMKRSGIPASITLAQGMLESANGNSRLATQANNHFGIKCHDWEGDRIYHDDNAAGECFRNYKSAKESYLDHTDFLMTRSRYGFLFNYKSTDYKNWAKGLREAGYATNPNYPQLLINLIERYDLHQYDTGVPVKKKTSEPEKENKADTHTATATTHKPSTEKKPTKTDGEFTISLDNYSVMENNRTNYIVAKEGDSYADLAKEMDMMMWQLTKYNETSANTTLREGQIVYLQPKRRKAERGNDTHTVQPGETMYDVSQKYGIKLKRLYVLNRMEQGSEPAPGEKLNLRKKKKKS